MNIFKEVAQGVLPNTFSMMVFASPTAKGVLSIMEPSAFNASNNIFPKMENASFGARVALSLKAKMTNISSILTPSMSGNPSTTSTTCLQLLPWENFSSALTIQIAILLHPYPHPQKHQLQVGRLNKILMDSISGTELTTMKQSLSMLCNCRLLKEIMSKNSSLNTQSMAKASREFRMDLKWKANKSKKESPLYTSLVFMLKRLES